jgi:cytochrome c
MRRSKGIFFVALVIPAILSLVAEGRQIEKRDAGAKQYTYNVNGKKVTLDFPVFLEGDDKKVTKDVFHGYQLYNSYCYRCHGTDATESSLAPDLRRFTAILAQKDFQSVVMAGREDKGMPSWRGFLSEEDVQQIYKYVKGRSLELVPSGRPPSEYD